MPGVVKIKQDGNRICPHTSHIKKNVIIVLKPINLKFYYKIPINITFISIT